MSSRVDDDSLGMAIVIGGALAALFLMSPYLSLRAATGEWGGAAVVVGVVYLVLTALAPYLPGVGAVVGFQWSLYAMWSAGYFTWANNGLERAMDMSPSGEGLDGMLLGLLSVAVVLVLAAVAFLVVPAVLAVAGGLVLNAPGLLGQGAWELRADVRGALGDADAPAFTVPRWADPHRHDADRILRRRHRIGVVATAVLLASAPLAVLVIFGPDGAKAQWLGLLWLASLLAAGIWRSTSQAILRDAEAWTLRDNQYTRMHARTVEQANAWAAEVHPDDLRDGRPVVDAILQDSLEAMHQAHASADKVAEEGAAAGPGWSPPSQAELDDATATLRRAAQQMARLRSEAAEYRAVSHKIEAEKRREAELQRMREDLAVMEAATDIYLATYSDTWAVLDELGAAGGLPEPSQARHNPTMPRGMPTTTLPESLEEVTSAGRLQEKDERWWAAVKRLRAAAGMTAAATARLRLMDESPRTSPEMDGDRAQDLINSIRARTLAERETAQQWAG